MFFKKMIIPVIAVGILAVGIVGWTQATEAANTTNQQTIIDKLAAKFNLKKENVSAIFDEARQERQKERQAMRESKLDEAVKAGAITSAQKEKLVEKLATRHQEMATERQENREEMNKWMTDNGIDSTKLHTYLGGENKGLGRGHGMRGFGGM